MSPTSVKFPTWWLLIVAGAIFLGIGVLAFIDPFSSYLKLVKFTGIGLLLNGAVLLTLVIAGSSTTREKSWMQAESILHLLFGILFIFNPLLSFIALPYFIGSWIFCIGVLKVLAALALRKTIRGWVFLLFVGVGCSIFALMLLFGSFEKARDMVTLIGSFGILMGGVYLIEAYRYRKMEDALEMML